MTARVAARAGYVLTERAYRALAEPATPIPETARIAARTHWVLTDRARAVLGPTTDRESDRGQEV